MSRLVLFSFILSFVSCESIDSDISGKWKLLDQSLQQEDVQYAFYPNMTYQSFYNGKEAEKSLPFTIDGDTIKMDRGEHWILIVGRDNRFIKDEFSLNSSNDSIILTIGDSRYLKIE